MKRFTGTLLLIVLMFSFSSALAQRVECRTGGFSVKLPDHFVEEPLSSDSDLCFYWHGNKLTVQAYVYYQGEVSGSDLFQVLDGSETDYGSRSYNGIDMQYIRTEEYGDVRISYTWMDRGNTVTLEFSYSADDPSVLDTVNSIMNSFSRTE